MPTPIRWVVLYLLELLEIVGEGENGAEPLDEEGGLANLDYDPLPVGQDGNWAEDEDFTPPKPRCAEDVKRGERYFRQFRPDPLERFWEVAEWMFGDDQSHRIDQMLAEHEALRADHRRLNPGLYD